MNRKLIIWFERKKRERQGGDTINSIRNGYLLSILLVGRTGWNPPPPFFFMRRFCKTTLWLSTLRKFCNL